MDSVDGIQVCPPASVSPETPSPVADEACGSGSGESCDEDDSEEEEETEEIPEGASEEGSDSSDAADQKIPDDGEPGRSQDDSKPGRSQATASVAHVTELDEKMGLSNFESPAAHPQKVGCLVATAKGADSGDPLTLPRGTDNSPPAFKDCKFNQVPRNGFKLKHFELGDAIDKKCLRISRGSGKNWRSDWEYSLVGFFIGKRLPFHVVNSIAMRLWKHKGLVEVAGQKASSSSNSQGQKTET